MSFFYFQISGKYIDVYFCAVTLNSHFPIDVPYTEQFVLPALTAEFLLHV